MLIAPSCMLPLPSCRTQSSTNVFTASLKPTSDVCQLTNTGQPSCTFQLLSPMDFSCPIVIRVLPYGEVETVRGLLTAICCT